jgi:hypothetical protein
MSPGPLIRSEEAKRNPDRYEEGYPKLRWQLENEGKARLSFDEFKKLPTYSSTVPTGICIGKVWKRGPERVPVGWKHSSFLVEGHWWLGRMEEDPDSDEHVLIRFYPLIVDRV